MKPHHIEWITVSIIIFILFLLCGSPAFVGQFILFFFFGWIWFIGRVAPEIQFDSWGVATISLCLILLAVGLHLFCGWLARNTRKDGEQENQAVRPWRWRWTLALVSVILLMFVSGISVVGVTHQTVWLATSDEPFLDPNSGSFRFTIERLETENNLKQIGLAMHAHQDAYKKLPAGAIYDNNGKALHGWQTPLLPYLEEGKLYKEIDLNLPWNHSKNAPYFKKELVIYLSYGPENKFDSEGFVLTNYASNVRVIGGSGTMTLQQITDGTSHTILAGQVGENLKPWGYPLNWRDPALGINKSPHGFGNTNKTGAVVAFADGSVRFLTNDVSPEVLKAMSTPNGGEEISEGN